MIGSDHWYYLLNNWKFYKDHQKHVSIFLTMIHWTIHNLMNFSQAFCHTHLDTVNRFSIVTALQILTWTPWNLVMSISIFEMTFSFELESVKYLVKWPFLLFLVFGSLLTAAIDCLEIFVLLRPLTWAIGLLSTLNSMQVWLFLMVSNDLHLDLCASSILAKFWTWLKAIVFSAAMVSLQILSNLIQTLGYLLVFHLWQLHNNH